MNDDRNTIIITMFYCKLSLRDIAHSFNISIDEVLEILEPNY